MKDSKPGAEGKKEKSLEELIEQLKDSLLVEGTRKSGVDDISGVLKDWLKDSKKH